MGAKMLGSTAFPWFLNGPLPLRTEECLVYIFCVMGVVLSVVAYDYQVCCFERFMSQELYNFPLDIIAELNFNG